MNCVLNDRPLPVSVIADHQRRNRPRAERQRRNRNAGIAEPAILHEAADKNRAGFASDEVRVQFSPGDDVLIARLRRYRVASADFAPLAARGVSISGSSVKRARYCMWLSA